MPSCLICQHAFEPFISFGRMPIANGFLTAEQFPEEYFFELKAGFCEHCTMVQLVELVEREKMFHANYPFFSSTSTAMAEHFREFADLVKKNYLSSSDPFVVEIGSNDGIMLRHFARNGFRHLGIEPSANVAQSAVAHGINTICEFFDAGLARKIVQLHGQADALLGANVMCHIPYLHSVIEGVKILLKPEGVLIFEDPYLGDIVEQTSYDQIYDEHAFYFSESSVTQLMERHGLEVIDVAAQAVHGGSMRYMIGRAGRHKVSAAVQKIREREKALALKQRTTFDKLKINIEKSRDDLVSLLQDLRRKGKRIAGYAATSKSTTVTNYCNITPELVEFISDTTPIKQGKFSPGMHIPVKPCDAFAANYPDYALLFGWNHAREIMAKEKEFRNHGGKWIVYVPKVQVLQ